MKLDKDLLRYCTFNANVKRQTKFLLASITFQRKMTLIRQEYSILTHVVQEVSVLYNLVLYWNNFYKIRVHVYFLTFHF